MKVNNTTGEIVETNDRNTEKYELAKNEVNALTVFDTWLEAKAQLLAVQDQFDIVDKKFREALNGIFDKYDLKSLENEYFYAGWRNGYSRKSWDSKKLDEFIYQNNRKPEEFKTEKWIEGGLTVKFKE